MRDRRVIFQRYHWDAYYVNNAGFGLDITILRQTFVLIFSRGRLR
jgi:lipopolysaccharide/colanic/teichoic acid biosynthesis glycosyltransferase